MEAQASSAGTGQEATTSMSSVYLDPATLNSMMAAVAQLGEGAVDWSVVPSLENNPELRSLILVGPNSSSSNTSSTSAVLRSELLFLAELCHMIKANGGSYPNSKERNELLDKCAGMFLVHDKLPPVGKANQRMVEQYPPQLEESL